MKGLTLNEINDVFKDNEDILKNIYSKRTNEVVSGYEYGLSTWLPNSLVGDARSGFSAEKQKSTVQERFESWRYTGEKLEELDVDSFKGTNYNVSNFKDVVRLNKDMKDIGEKIIQSDKNIKKRLLNLERLSRNQKRLKVAVEQLQEFTSDVHDKLSKESCPDLHDSLRKIADDFKKVLEHFPNAVLLITANHNSCSTEGNSADSRKKSLEEMQYYIKRQQLDKKVPDLLQSPTGSIGSPQSLVRDHPDSMRSEKSTNSPQSKISHHKDSSATKTALNDQSKKEHAAEVVQVSHNHDNDEINSDKELIKNKSHSGKSSNAENVANQTVLDHETKERAIDPNAPDKLLQTSRHSNEEKTSNSSSKKSKRKRRKSSIDKTNSKRGRKNSSAIVCVDKEAGGGSEVIYWKVDTILSYRIKGKKTEFLVKWEGGEESWEPSENLCDSAIDLAKNKFFSESS